VNKIIAVRSQNFTSFLFHRVGSKGDNDGILKLTLQQNGSPGQVGKGLLFTLLVCQIGC
jgi:hypothetical protein